MDIKNYTIIGKGHETEVIMDKSINDKLENNKNIESKSDDKIKINQNSNKKEATASFIVTHTFLPCNLSVINQKSDI